MRHIMHDLETLGTVPGCAILSIGAVAFDPLSGWVDPEGFYRVVFRPSCEEAFLSEDPDTLEWWSKQNAEARAVLEHVESLETSVPLDVALDEFNHYAFTQGGPDVRMWGNGADFDNAITAAAMDAVKKKPIWKFWNNRCYRTIKNLAPDLKLNRTGTYHNALDDARTQTTHLLSIASQRGFVLS